MNQAEDVKDGRIIKTITKMTPVLKTGIVILLDFDGLSFEEKVH